MCRRHFMRAVHFVSADAQIHTLRTHLATSWHLLLLVPPERSSIFSQSITNLILPVLINKVFSISIEKVILNLVVFNRSKHWVVFTFRRVWILDKCAIYLTLRRRFHILRQNHQFRLDVVNNASLHVNRNDLWFLKLNALRRKLLPGLSPNSFCGRHCETSRKYLQELCACVYIRQ